MAARKRNGRAPGTKARRPSRARDAGKNSRTTPVAKPATAHVVYRDKRGRFTKRDGRKAQGVSVGKDYLPPKRRNKKELSRDVARHRQPKQEIYTSTTDSGTMADRVLACEDERGRALASAFTRGPRGGVVAVEAGELSFVVFIAPTDLKEFLAAVLVDYFQNVYATRARVSSARQASRGNKSPGTHAGPDYTRVRYCNVTVRLTT